MTESTRCPQCSGEMPANFPPGVCPACLLKQGMSPSTLTGAAGEESSAGDSHVSGLGRRHSWTPPTPAELAPRFPQLEIAELLGQGGMGAVYKVRQKELDRWAALKILPGEVASDPNFAERFQREARALAQLSHQHIVTVYEFGQRDGVFFLLMEFVDGVTLRQAIRAGTSGNPVSGRALAAGPVQLPAASALPLTGNDHGMAFPPHSPLAATIDAPQALAIVTQLCDALQFAHEEGIVHRDIKPENILIDKRGRVKIADFGLAKLLGKQPNFPTLTGTHQIMGTPVYMAPEQMEGTKGVDHRADIFSLGVVFYELLTGELPLGRFAPPSQKYSLDVRLDEVVLRTLEKEPDRRYQQASEVKLDVESIRSQPVAGIPTKQESPRHSWTLRRLAMLLSIAVLGTFVCLAGFVVVANGLYYSLFKPQPAYIDISDISSGNSYKSQTFVSPPAIDWELRRIEQQRQEQTRQQQLELAARDPLEVNAVVQFTADGVKLHPRSIGSLLTPEQRILVEKILTDIHREYLKAEAGHCEFETENAFQTVTISPFGEDLVRLENELWTAVDTQLPISAQKLLRLNLPLYTDHTQRLPQVSTSDGEGNPFGSAGGSGGMAMFSESSPVGAGSFGGSGMMGHMEAPAYLRYQQLLGWKQTYLPMHISIGRRGKWFTWTLKHRTPEVRPAAAAYASEPAMQIVTLDHGEAPELPSGLKRFWREAGSDGVVSTGGDSATSATIPLNDSPEAAYQRQHQALITRQWKKYADTFTEEARDEFSFLMLLGCRDDEGAVFMEAMRKACPVLNRRPDELKVSLNDFAQKYRQTPPTPAEFRAAATPFIRQVLGEQSKAFFKNVEEIRHKDAGNLAATDIEWGALKMLSTDENEAHGSLVGLADFPAEHGNPITFKRQNGQWKIDSLEELPMHLESFLSGELKRSPRSSLPSPPDRSFEVTRSLDVSLRELDALRAADKTPWEVVEQRANELLAKYTTPADKGRIHWMAAHVYGQSDIRGHAADVIRHAQEALKYERDPVQRGWLYMCLGDAAGLEPKSKEEATRWYLKGYLELLSFNLPDKAPELPSVGKYGGDLRGSSNGEVDSELIGIEVKRAAEMKARQDAEFTRELVSRRDIYIRQLADLDARGNPLDGKDAKPESQLRAIATEVLRDQTAIEQLLKRVALSKPILDEKPPE